MRFDRYINDERTHFVMNLFTISPKETRGKNPISHCLCLCQGERESKGEAEKKDEENGREREREREMQAHKAVMKHRRREEIWCYYLDNGAVNKGYISFTDGSHHNEHKPAHQHTRRRTGVLNTGKKTFVCTHLRLFVHLPACEI